MKNFYSFSLIPLIIKMKVVEKKKRIFKGQTINQDDGKLRILQLE